MQTYFPSYFRSACIGNFMDWVKQNATDHNTLGDNTLWSCKFMYTLWEIWKARNTWVFEAKCRSPVEVVKSATFQAEEARRWLVNHGVTRMAKSIWVGWTPPDGGWVKLNTNGARKGATVLASAGGLIRNQHGNWICGFSVKIGVATSFIAECWGLREGLRMFKGLNLERVIIEMDTEIVINLMKDKNGDSDTRGTLIRDYKALVDNIRHVMFSHTLREGNKCVDWLANFGQGTD